MKELEKAKEIFLTDVDPETYQENLEKITGWEKDLAQNAAYAKWQQQDITQQILDQAKKAYQDASVSLALNRDLTEEQRNKLYATQDGCMVIIGLMAKDAKGTIQQLQNEIRQAVRAVA